MSLIHLSSIFVFNCVMHVIINTTPLADPEGGGGVQGVWIPAPLKSIRHSTVNPQQQAQI